MRIQLSGLSLPNMAATLMSALRSVPVTEYVAVTSPATPSLPFIVKHSLGVKPKFASSMANGNGHIYVTANDMAEWTDKQIKVRHQVANDRIVVKVEA